MRKLDKTHKKNVSLEIFLVGFILNSINASSILTLTKDRLFDVLNDADNLPIQDIVVDDKSNMVDVCPADGTRFAVHVENCGNWCIYEV